jgi:hypothetical protein
MLSRREFIKFTGLIGVAVLAPLRRLGWLQTVGTGQIDEPPGELYAGFVLLPEGSAWPPFVQCAPAPILGQVDDEHNPDVLALRGETLWFDNLSEMINNIPFSTYVPNSLPKGTAFVQGYIIHFAQSGEVFEARTDFGTTEGNQPLFNVSARPVFPRPYPIWPVNSPAQGIGLTRPENDEIVMHPEKINFTPTPGLMLATAVGYSLQWIKQDILYTLVVENDHRRDSAVQIMKSLVET